LVKFCVLAPQPPQVGAFDPVKSEVVSKSQ
jgi:hypothetical protein